MNPIGGFLPLESWGAAGATYHQAPALSTGRACFRFVLEHLRPRIVRIPFFVCDAMLVPLLRLRIPFRYYSLDHDLRPGVAAEDLGAEELLVIVHYFGVQGDEMRQWSESTRGRVVIDDSQAFFRRGHPGTWSFNSARKFFGLPDGAYLFGPAPEPFPFFPPAVPSISHLESRLVGRDVAYEQFRNHENSLDDEFRRMSALSARAMAGLAYDEIAARRRANYKALAKVLGDRNRLRLEPGERDVPLYYPFVGRRAVRESLIRRGILVPRLWPELNSRSERTFDWERELSSNLAPLPVDQRYDASAMETVAEAVIESLGKE